MEPMEGTRETAVLLTGASGSIGAEVARKLAQRGMRLALTGRREDRLHELAREIETATGRSPAVLPADLGHSGNVEKLAADATETLGGVDVLVNNAGVTMQGLIWVAGDGDEARQLFETNSWSPIALVAALAPGMIERGGGAVVNVGSIAGASAIPRLGHYSTSRAALTLATEVMQKELGPRGVRVVEVVFGPIDTPARREGGIGNAPGQREGSGIFSLPGRLIDKGPMLGQIDQAAETIVKVVTGKETGAVFYPGPLRASRAVPQLTRLFAGQASTEELHNSTVQFGPPSDSPGDSGG
jgi:uncharacterized protein